MYELHGRKMLLCVLCVPEILRRFYVISVARSNVYLRSVLDSYGYIAFFLQISSTG